MHDFTDQQRATLLANPNIKELTNNFVVYTPKFKLSAVEKYLKGMSANQIFQDAGIDVEFFKEDYARCCLKKWIKKFREQGPEAFKKEARGSSPSAGRPAKENLDELTIDELKALVEIQQEFIEHLKKKKALTKKTKK